MACGRYVALLDDDCRPSREWVESAVRIHDEFPHAAVAGGPIRLEFELPPPDWLVGEFRTCLSELDRGPVVRTLDPGECVFGANMSFRRSVFEACGGFPEDIGMRTRRPPQLANDEIAFIQEASRTCGSGPVYCPRMSVTHFIPASRVRLERMFQRRFGQGLSDAALTSRHHAGDPGEAIRQYVKRVFPHPWHQKQLQERLRSLEPQTAEKYLYNHLLCRTAYLWGYRRALQDSIETPVQFANAGFTEPDGETRAVTSRLADLMYRRDDPGASPGTVRQADDRLRLLVAMAHSLEPGLFQGEGLSPEPSGHPCHSPPSIADAGTAARSGVVTQGRGGS